ncbi:pyridoxal-phosphate dependent enzyme [Gramella sp. AN32]|uniref:1-aminocyclopropane-1-carboxylate deaminase/D-cysteine desulfhydrase n=1 Tax=Christiangramia antarctica TaxID=2058158 RepID=A0ABW5X8I9_9FLAO|nr:pyridoxal-phosphate dependent enzyme [Gramella sp. AN32]MCM4155267.1 1-aminocyclopropane-1-carboxylate deaminase [Gramella sp. AN32]
MQDFFDSISSENIPNQFLRKFEDGVEVWIKREDLLHPEVSGNKFRKLKYNLREAKATGFLKILTFGGAHSNHIAATAAAGNIYEFQTIGIIRGDELKANRNKWSATLKYAKSCGMSFEFVSREKYREKESASFLKELRSKFGKFYLLPEGGINDLAIKGCAEILNSEDRKFDFIAVSVGTGGTIGGLIKSAGTNQKVLGFPALKSAHFKNDVTKLVVKTNWELFSDYHFGGYAKVDAALIDFMNKFSKEFKILLDPVYTGKLLFGIFDLAEKGYFPANSKVLAIHTGGFQGIPEMNRLLKNKNLPQINLIDED